MHLAVLVDVCLLEGVLVPLAVLEVVCVEARVLEWTVALPFVEVHAWDLGDVVCVLLHQLLLHLPIEDHACRRYDQVAILTTDGARPEMRLLNLFVVGRAPVTNAVEAKSV